MVDKKIKAEVLFPGSFDPLTNGHVRLIERISKQFGRLLVGVAENTNKNCTFTVEERVAFIREHFKDNEGVIVDSFSGLLVDYLKDMEISLVVRGLRAVSDYEYEVQMALLNKSLSLQMYNREIDTFFLHSTENESYISSSFIKQVAKLDGDVSAFVPSNVVKGLKDKLT